MRLRSILFITLFVLFALVSASPCVAQEKPAAVSQLTPNQTTEREMTGAETHRYKFDLQANEFFQVRVEQKGVDVALKLIDAGGKVLATMDSPNEKQGSETLSFVAVVMGNYLLDVRGLDSKAEKGIYTIRRETSRTATAKDRRRVEVEQLFVAGMTARDADGQAEIALKKLEAAEAGWQELNDEYLSALTAQQVKQLKDTAKKAQADSIFAEARTLANKGSAASRRGSLLEFSEARRLYQEILDKQSEASCLVWLGYVHSALGEQQKALEFFNLALPLFKAVGDRGSEATALNNIGGVYDALGEKQKAREFYNLALPLFRAVGDRGGEAATLYYIGGVYDDLGERLKALEFYDLALRLRRAVGDRGGEATTLNNIGGVYAALGEMQKALEFFNLALPLHRAVGDRGGEAATLNYIGDVYSRLGEKQKAFEFYSLALPLFRAVGDRAGEAATLNSLGGVYDDLGEKQKALDFYHLALPLRRAVGDRGGEADTLNNIGNIYNSLGEKQKALEFYNLALPLHRAVGDRGEATTLTNIGGVYDDLGEKQKALEFYDIALPLFRTVGDRAGEAGTLNNIGLVYAELGDKQKALEFHNLALQLRRAVGDRAGEAATLHNIGTVYAELGEKQKALEFLNLALPLFRAVGDRGGEATTLNNIGLVYDSLGEKQKALEFYNLALPLLKAVGNRNVEAITLANFMYLWNHLGKPALAIFYGKQSINAYQQLRGNIQGLDKELQKSFLGTVESSYRYLADLLIAQGRIPEAERVLEMLKEEEFFQYTRRDKAVASALLTRADLSDKEQKALDEYSKIADQLTSIGSELSVLEAQRLKLPEEATFPKQARLDELKDQLAVATKSFQVFQRQLEDQFGKTDVRVAQIESGLQSDLKSWGVTDTVIISTLVGTDRLQIIVTIPTVQEPHTIEISAAKLNALVADFRNALKDPRIDPRPAAEKLYEVLVKPIEGDLAGAKAKTLIWSLDGTLRYVPIAALWDGKHYLVERFQNVVIALASRSKVALVPLPVNQWRGLGLGVSKRWGSFPALDAVPDELKGIIRQDSAGGAAANERGVLPGRRLLDADFTRSNLERALGRYSVIHIASHFDFLPGKERSSSLLLGDGTPLTLDAISSSTPMFDKVELLTLSACNTATGGDAEGAEVEGFGVLAQKQGALAVLATLWEVADTSTGQLMREFYRQRVTHAEWNKAEALRQAQLSLLHGDSSGENATTKRSDTVETIATVSSSATRAFTPDPNAKYSHPYYWAPFILIGNWK